MHTTKGKDMTTRERIQKAIREMGEAGSKMTISGVAKEAGVSNATIHNRYPDLADQIRDLVKEIKVRESKKVRRTWKGKIKTPKDQIQELRNELIAIKEKLAKAHSVNLSLDQKNQSLKAENKDLKIQLVKAVGPNKEGKVTTLQKRTPGEKT